MFNIRKFLGLAFYVSSLDQFLKKYDETHPHLTDSQKAEVDKYKEVYARRDHAVVNDTKPTLWDKF